MYVILGYVMSQEYPCDHPGTSEGIGLKETAHGVNLGAGRVQWGSESHYFYAATIEVRGIICIQNKYHGICRRA